MTRDTDKMLTISIVALFVIFFLYATDGKIRRTVADAVKEQCK